MLRPLLASRTAWLIWQLKWLLDHFQDPSAGVNVAGVPESVTVADHDIRHPRQPVVEHHWRVEPQSTGLRSRRYPRLSSQPFYSRLRLHNRRYKTRDHAPAQGDGHCLALFDTTQVLRKVRFKFADADGHGFLAPKLGLSKSYAVHRLWQPSNSAGHGHVVRRPITPHHRKTGMGIVMCFNAVATRVTVIGTASTALDRRSDVSTAHQRASRTI